LVARLFFIFVVVVTLCFNTRASVEKERAWATPSRVKRPDYA
jgi:hypothetical protein